MNSELHRNYSEMDQDNLRMNCTDAVARLIALAQISCIIIHRESKKSRQSSFCRNFIKKIPPHLKRVATLRREI